MVTRVPVSQRLDVHTDDDARRLDAFADVFAWWHGLSIQLVGDVDGRVIGEGQSGVEETTRAGAQLLDRSGDFRVELDGRDEELVGLRARVTIEHPADSWSVPDSVEIAGMALPCVFSRTTLLGSFDGSVAELVAEDDDAALLHASSGQLPIGALRFGRTAGWRGWVRREDFVATNAKTVLWCGASPPGVRVGTWVEVDGRLFPLRFPDKGRPVAALDSSFPEFPRASVASPYVGASAAVPWSEVTAEHVFSATAEVSGVPVRLDASVWPWRSGSIRVEALGSIPERAPDGCAWRSSGSDPTVGHVRYVDLERLSLSIPSGTFGRMSYVTGPSH